MLGTILIIVLILLLIGALPFWDALRRRPQVQAALLGVNAAVVGLLLAALYRPVWISAIFGYGPSGILGLILVVIVILLLLGRL